MAVLLVQKEIASLPMYGQRATRNSTTSWSESCANRQSKREWESQQAVRTSDRVSPHLQTPRQIPRCPKSSLLLQAALASAGRSGPSAPHQGHWCTPPLWRSLLTACVRRLYSVAAAMTRVNAACRASSSGISIPSFSTTAGGIASAFSRSARPSSVRSMST